MVSRENLREKAQKEAYNIADHNFRVKKKVKVSKEDKANWTSILEIYPVDTTNLSSIEKAVDDIEEKGYAVSIHKDKSNNIYLSVLLTQDAQNRLLEN